MMLKYLYYLILVFYENYLYEFEIPDGCSNIYLLLIYHKYNSKFNIHHHRHSRFFVLMTFLFNLVRVSSNNLILNRFYP